MSYPKKIYWRALIVLVAIFGLFLLITLFSAYLSLRDSTKYGILVMFLLGFLFYPLNEQLINWIDKLLDPILDKTIKSAKRAKRGIDGEGAVAEWLVDIVGKGHFVRNVELPGHHYDFDAVIVGEKGVIVLEVKNLTDPIRFDGEDYYRIKDGKSTLLSPEKDPRFKLQSRVYELKQYLNSNGFGNIMTQKALVISNGLVTWSGPVETYIVKDKDHLKAYIEGLRIDPACTPQVRAEILQILQKG